MMDMRVWGIGTISRLVLLLILCDLLFPRSAYAYLDPAIGSYITQIIIATVVGGLFIIKQYFYKIKSFFKNLSARGKKPQ